MEAAQAAGADLIGCAGTAAPVPVHADATLLPELELGRPSASQVEDQVGTLAEVAPAPRDAARALLPEIEMGFAPPDAEAEEAPPTPAAAPERAQLKLLQPAFARPLAPHPIPAPETRAAPLLASEPAPPRALDALSQAARGDPLAALKAMSEEELIALFS